MKQQRALQGVDGVIIAVVRAIILSAPLALAGELLVGLWSALGVSTLHKGKRMRLPRPRSTDLASRDNQADTKGLWGCRVGVYVGLRKPVLHWPT